MAGSILKLTSSILIVLLLSCSFLILLSKLDFKKSILFILTLHAISISMIFYALWPFTPNAKVGIESTSNTFLQALSQGDSEKALSLVPGFVSLSEIERGIHTKSIVEPSNFPINWQITSINARDTVVAEVELADGTVDEIILYAEWNWGKGRWGISSAFFQNERNRLRMINYIIISTRYPFIPHQTFYTISILFGVFILFLGRMHIPPLKSLISV